MGKGKSESKKGKTERKQAENALREERDRAQKYLDVAGVMFVAINRDGIVTLINKKGCKILGYDESEVIGKNWFDNFIPKKIATEIKPISKLLLAGKIEPAEYHENPILTKNGEERLIAWHNTIIRNEDGNIVGHLSSGEDITKRKQVEEAIIESEDKFRGIVEQSSDGITLLDDRGHIVEWNQAQEQVTGFKREEVMGKPFWDILNKSIPKTEKYRGRYQQIKSLFQDYFKTGKAYWLNKVNERRIQRPDGAVRVVESLVFPITSSKGAMLGSISRDITEKKQAEKELKDSEEKFKTLFETSPDAILVSDMEGNIINYNQQFIKLHAVKKPDKLAGRNVSEFFIEEDHPQLIETINKTITKGPQGPVDYTMIRENGSQFIAETECSVIPGSDGKPVGLIGIARDITERKRAEEELRESEEKLSSVLQKSPIPTAVGGLDGSIISFNEALENLIGYKRSEINDTTDWGGKLYPNKKYRAFVEENIKQALSGEKQECTEFTVTCKDGSTKVVDFHTSFFKGGLVIQMIDITERKKAEGTLRSSEEKWRNLVKNTPDIILNLDLDGKILFINHTESDRKLDDVIGRSVYDFIPPEQYKKTRDSIKKVIKSGRSVTFEVGGIHPNGASPWYSTRLGPIKQGKKIVGIALISTNITDRKRAQEELKESEGKFRSLFENSGNPVTVVDRDGIILMINQIGAKNIRIPQEKCIGQSIFQLLPKMDDSFHKIYRQVVDEGIRISREDYIDLPSAPRWFWSVHEPVSYSNGEKYGVQIISYDITERKRAEEALKESEEKYSSLIKHIPDVTWTTDTNGKTTFISPNVKDIYGYAPDLIYKKSDKLWFGRIHPDDIKKVKKSFKALFGKGTALDVEYRIKHKNGHWIWLKDRSLGTYEKDGRMYADGVFFDITERKHAEEELHRFEHIVSSSTDMMALLDNDYRYLAANSSYIDTFKITRDKLIGHTVVDVFGERFFNEVIKPNADRCLKGEEINYQSRFDFPDEPKYMDINYYPYLNENNEIKGFVVNGRDITKRKQADEALILSESRYKALFESAPIAIGITDFKGNLINGNHTMEQITGYTIEELKKIKIFSIYENPKIRGDIVKQLKEKGKFRDYEIKVKRKDGEIITVLFNGDLVELNEQKFILTTARDITERKRAEEALRESEESLQNFMSASTEGFTIFDSKLNYVDINDSALAVGGVQKEEVIGKNVVDLIPDVKETGRYDAWMKVIKTGKPSFEADIITHPIYGEIHLDIRAFKVGDGLGVITHDITDSIKANNAKLESEEKYRNLVERANDGIVIVQDGIMKFSNTRLAEILGYAIDEMIDTPFINYVYPADRKKLIDIYKRRIKGENVPGIYEMGGLNKDGSKIDIETNSGIITYKGKPAVLSLIRDITERKQVEEALKNAKEFTDTALNTQLDTFFLFEPSTSKAVRWNHAFTEITGYTDEEVSRMPAPVSYFSSEDMERAGAFIHKVLEDGTGTIDLELICKDGRKIPTEYKVSVIKDEQGIPKYLISIGRDITERKRAEEALGESEERLFSFMDSASDSFYLIDSNLNLVEINKKGLELIGKSKKEVIGKHISDISPDIKSSGRYEQYLNVMRTGKPYAIDDFVPHPVLGDLHFSLKSFKVGDGLGVITSDITHRKLAEEQTRIQRDLVRSLSEMTNLEEAVKVCVNTAIKVTGMDSGGAYLTNRDTSGLDLLYSQGLSPEFIEAKSHFDAKAPNTKLIMLGKPIYAFYPELKLPQDVINNPEGLRAIAIVPINHENKVIGCLNIASHKIDDISNATRINLESIAAQIGSAIARLQASKALKESEEKFRGIAEGSFDLIFMIDLDGKFTYVSPAVEKILGYVPELLIGKPLEKFLPEDEKIKIDQVQSKFLAGDPVQGFEMKLQSKRGSILHFESNINPILKDDKLIGFQGIARDITERKAAEEEMKKRLMKFKLEEGNLYLVQEETPKLALESMKDLLKVGYIGLVISRTPIKEMKRQIKGDLKFYWLSEKAGEGTLNPSLTDLEKLVQGLQKRKIILLDRMEYLISKHGFKKVLDLINQLKDIAVLSNHIIITSIDPVTIRTREIRLLEKETSEIELTQRPKLPGHQLDIIKFIYNQNIIGLKPSHSDICKEMSISKPTARKRIRELTLVGYVLEDIKGRNKVVELTERGKNIFS